MNAQAQENLNLFNSDARVRAFEEVVRRAEGTYGNGDNGYNVFFGGSLFNSYARHPNIAHTIRGLTSTAAGGHQWLNKTWQGVSAKLGLTDFTPQSQIAAFVEKIRERGALSKLLANDFDGAIRASNREWASLPESPYGQGTKTWAQVRNWYNNALGGIGIFNNNNPSNFNNNNPSNNITNLSNDSTSSFNLGSVILILLVAAIFLKR